MTKILILDGGLGTTLEAEHGCVFTSAATPLWSSHLVVASPSTLLACQRSFARVPIDVLLTATYQASIHGFAGTVTDEHPHGITEPLIPGYLDRAVAIAEEAVAPEVGGDTAQRTKVALSLGPYGACMIPSQEYSGIYDDAHSTAAQLQSWHLARTQLFSSIRDVSSRVSLIALETIPRLDEITAMREALHSVPELSSVPYWTSCLYPETGAAESAAEDDAAHYLLPDGSTAEDAVYAMLDPDVGPLPWGIGINCTKAWKLEGLLRRYEAAVSRMVQQGRIPAWPALVLYPDGTSGEVYNTETQKWELPAAQRMGSNASSWEDQVAEAVRGTVARGQWSEVLVGGCCMASPAHIKRLRDVLVPAKS